LIIHSHISLRNVHYKIESTIYV